MTVAVWYQLNGYKTKYTIPEKNLNIKINKIVQEVGVENIKKMGFKNSNEFKDKIKRKMQEVA